MLAVRSEIGFTEPAEIPEKATREPTQPCSHNASLLLPETRDMRVPGEDR